MKKIASVSISALLLSSCVSNKKFAALGDEYSQLKDLHEKNLSDLSRTQRELIACQTASKQMDEQLAYLRTQNQQLISNIGDFTTLTAKGAQNLEKSLESINEKDTQIKKLNEAINRKDSVTIALVTSIKGALGNLYDEDITVQVEKGVVFVSISDKFLFKSGSYQINSAAKDVLGKVATILKSKPQMDVMIEGHTDNVPFTPRGELLDNWDLSVKRSTALVRMLQKDFSINPARMTAAGRSEYIPLQTNETKEGRAANRRTRIIILPKLDQFFGMIEDGLKGE
jgi:chemotaxis protein MotB